MAGARLVAMIGSKAPPETANLAELTAVWLKITGIPRDSASEASRGVKRSATREWLLGGVTPEAGRRRRLGGRDWQEKEKETCDGDGFVQALCVGALKHVGLDGEKAVEGEAAGSKGKNSGRGGG